MKILVTGGAGYIGSVLVPRLLELSHEVTVYDNLMYGQDSLLSVCHYSGFTFLKGDVCDYNTVIDLANKHDVFIPLAAIVGAPACEAYQSRSYQVNYVSINATMRHLDRRVRVIYPNTNSGYGVSDEVCTEETPTNPVSNYGRQKRLAEKSIIASGNPYTIFRLATVFGVSPRMRLDLMVNDFVYKALSCGVIKVFDPTFRRNFIHIRDVADAFCFATMPSDNLTNQIFNVGNDSLNMTKLELAHIVAKHTGADILADETKTDPDKRDYVVSSRKIYDTGWLPEFSIEDGIKEIGTWYSMHHDNYRNL